jgi:hypothetical protein
MLNERGVRQIESWGRESLYIGVLGFSGAGQGSFRVI